MPRAKPDVTVLFATVIAAVVPMIAAGFLWPADWPLILRQITIAIWGIGVVFVAEGRVSGRVAHRTFAALGVSPPRWRAVLVATLAAIAMFLAAPLVATVTGLQWGVQPGWLPTLIGVILVNGMAEEVIHRAYLFRHLRERFAFGPAAAIAAAAFAIQHLYLTVSLGLIAGLAATALAVALTMPLIVFYERGGRSLLPPAILHTGSNASVMLFLAPPEQQVLLLPHMGIVLAALYGAMALLVFVERLPSATRGHVPPGSGTGW